MHLVHLFITNSSVSEHIVLKKLVETLNNDLSFNRLVLVFGVLSDKDVESMVSLVLPVSDVVIFTKSKNPRACNPKTLHNIAKKKGMEKEMYNFSTIPQALDFAHELLQKDDLLCITGSLFTVGEARSYLLEKEV